MLYLDSSAIVKLVVRETESRALRTYLRRHPVRVTSALARVEVPRAVHHLGGAALHRAREVLGRIDQLRLDAGLLDAAADLEPNVLRSLDAIHLASARLLGDELSAVVTYDRRMAEAASLLGLQVIAPD